MKVLVPVIIFLLIIVGYLTYRFYYQGQVVVPKTRLINCGLDGLSFNSVDPQLLGEGPGGTANMGYWQISFEKGAYQRFYSDVGENGTYTCADGVIELKTGYGGPMTASYDEDSGVLTLDGVEHAVFHGL